MDASNMLKPLLARGQLRLIGATTLDEYRQHIEKDAALERRFQQVFVGQPSVEDTIAILRGLKERYEVHHGVRITDAAIVSAATLSNRYITDRFLPDKAIDLMDEAASRIRMEVESKPEEIETLDRRIIQLKIEREALKKEKDAASKERLKALESELAGLEEQSGALTTRWQAEKEKIAGEAVITRRYRSLVRALDVQHRQAGRPRRAYRHQAGRGLRGEQRAGLDPRRAPGRTVVLGHELDAAAAADDAARLALRRPVPDLLGGRALAGRRGDDPRHCRGWYSRGSVTGTKSACSSSARAMASTPKSWVVLRQARRT
jgi:hypothetical protein